MTIPSYEALTAEERAAVDLGRAWPVRVEELKDPDRFLAGRRPVHLALIDFLIEDVTGHNDPQEAANLRGGREFA